ncbi:uncharacterized protein LOC106706602 [Latimeria chalumnae]|uniref:uncharacterized protein LOC106706602 n=1 Tax=Latimeria chalumnae TaxID=7897 RepID=UPI0006D9393A|nr:PREDICTED: uncharacterized protein LOC106706602 [Latimeria chalumnae]|eukprot:XP_014353257.1 PREDICTED: uncharacterized protein LOC106706602 [Latimeria chalumnae]
MVSSFPSTPDQNPCSGGSEVFSELVVLSNQPSLGGKSGSGSLDLHYNRCQSPRLGGSKAQGLWFPREQRFPINILEMRAVFRALLAFKLQIQGLSVKIQTDNITMSYIIKQGGTKSPLMLKEAVQVLHWAVKNLKNLSAVFLAGKLNTKVDWLSRQLVYPGEWSLHLMVFCSICDLWGSSTINLFASKANAKLPRYLTRFQDDSAVAIDAFSILWDFPLVYAFPPWPLIPATLEKVKTDGTSIILIAPDWPCRPWYSDLLNLAVAPPLYLPLRSDLLLQGPVGHPNLASFRLLAWLLKGADHVGLHLL